MSDKSRFVSRNGFPIIDSNICFINIQILFINDWEDNRLIAKAFERFVVLKMASNESSIQRLLSLASKQKQLSYHTIWVIDIKRIITIVVNVYGLYG